MDQSVGSPKILFGVRGGGWWVQLPSWIKGIFAVDLDQTGSNEYGGWVVGLVAKFSTTVVLVPCTVGYRTTWR